MSKIPEDYLPPEDLRPTLVRLVPEVQAYPDRLNVTQELLDRGVEAGRGDRPAVLFQDRTVTYAALQGQVNRLGNVLASRGVGEDDRVVILSPNQPLSVAANLAIIKIGAIPVPASPLLSPPELTWVVNNSEAAALLVHPAMLPLVAKTKGDFDHEVATLAIAPPSDELSQAGVESVVPLMEQADGQLEPVLRDRDAVGVLLYTSGTTGKPKGVVHLVEEFLAIADTFGKEGWKLREDDILFSPAPLAFAAGYGAMAVIPFRFGAAVSLMPRFEPEAAFETIQQHKATVLTILPTSYRKMLQVPDAEKKYDLSSVRMCTGGGEALTAETYHRWQDRFGLEIFEGLGTTEMFYVFVTNAVTEKAKPGSIGTAVPGYEVKVVDEEGNEVGPGDIGKLVARGPTGTMYWRPDEEGGRLMDSQRHAVVGEGWNLAGDYVQFDEDGYLWFVSREDDLIKSSGYRIGPDEIEVVIAKHPAVADVGVIGVPDPVRGQNTKAVVVVKEGTPATDALKQEIIDFCRDKIAVYKLPREVEFVDELPRTVTGKLLRRVLRGKEQEARSQ
jgi:2-aminobenzoate-CoA ligase